MEDEVETQQLLNLKRLLDMPNIKYRFTFISENCQRFYNTLVNFESSIIASTEVYDVISDLYLTLVSFIDTLNDMALVDEKQLFIFAKDKLRK